jgi:hypothetical protein
MRWNAPGVVGAARAEHLPVDDALVHYAQRVQADPAFLPGVPDEVAHDVALARSAVTVALRRHGRPPNPSSAPRPLREVALVVGSGGVLRHHDDAVRHAVLSPATSDHGGGWRVPEHARLAVDDRYVLFAAGLLAEQSRGAAAALVSQALRAVAG